MTRPMNAAEIAREMVEGDAICRVEMLARMPDGSLDLRLLCLGMAALFPGSTLEDIVRALAISDECLGANIAERGVL